MMNSVDPNVLVKIVNAMNDINEDEVMTTEKARKNSKPVTS